MSDNLIYTKTFSAPAIDRREVFRYAGVKEPIADMESMLDECIAETNGVLNYKVCYRVYNIEASNDAINLGFVMVNSLSLLKAMRGCGRAVVFCATIGPGIDRLIAKYSIVSPAKAVLLQALGSERVEAVCEAFCEYVKNEVACGDCTRRFSPGYGDLSLELQREIFVSLDCTRRIGVNLSDALFMTPSKSVTAIIGYKNVNS